MKKLKARLKAFFHNLKVRKEMSRQRRVYFRDRYLSIYNYAEEVYHQFCMLCETDLVDEDNIIWFNKEKTAIVYNNRRLIRFLYDVNSQIDRINDLDRKTQKRRNASIKIAQEIAELCDDF